MHHTLLHIWGPFSIHSFGFMIAVGLILFTWLIQQNKERPALLSVNQLVDIILVGIIAGIAGGRILYLLCNWDSIETWTEPFMIWLGGLSMLGVILGALAIVPLYVRSISVPILPFCDLVTLYTPIFEACVRVGCFLAGCCFGKPTTLFWGVTYTDPNSIAPLGVCLHPTQLYNTATSLIVFLVLYYVCKPAFKKPGQLFCMYLMLTSTQRFIIDFWRNDQEFLAHQSLQFFSINQWVALMIATGACAGFLYITHIPSLHARINHEPI